VSISTEFTSVDTQEGMDEFLWLVSGFHDALLREVGIVARGYIDPDSEFYDDVAPSDIRLVIHSSFPETPYVEIIVEELQKFRWEYGWDLDPAEGIVAESEVTLVFGQRPESFIVSGRKIRYRILGREFLGKKLHAVQQIVEIDCD